jgi:transposase-like protein
MNEILNMDYHRCRLILKSLNSSKTIKEAADKCGLNKRTMHTWRKNYNIIKNKDGVYERKNISWKVSIE